MRPGDSLGTLAWAVRRREEKEAERDLRMLRAALNAMIYVQDPKQFSSFAEIAEPLIPERMRTEVKGRADEEKRRAADRKLRASLDLVKRSLDRRT